MRELCFSELEMIEGGDWIGGFCGVLGGAGAIAYIAGATAVTGGVGGAILGIGLVGCGAYGIYSMMG